ncbi:MAG: helix-turn-helix domain-containing protein [Oligoflexia bacterium]|nr:helix-turn-helix domain-containing protein [Oligoflexia bacterium]MBF0367369.1 helix-turn-helix domain-containing protein [Oligoflexia bacterium]
MLLDQETLRLIFGLKLRQFRQEKGLSLKELGNISGLSASYINEIEKGKKYPKNDKIMLLANSLGVPYDDLISVRLNKELKHLTKILENNLLKNLPFDLFGIPAQGLLELITNEPNKFKILVGTLVELARGFNLRVKDFLFASLRAYIELKNNYFEEVEDSVQAFLEKHNWSPLDAHSDVSFLAEVLKHEYHYDLQEVDFKTYPELSDLKHVIIPLNKRGGKRFRFLLNKNLSVREKNFIYAKEIGHHFLDQGERSYTSIWLNLDSYEQLYNNFKASYFASALFIPKDDFIIKTRNFFQNPKWDGEQFFNILKAYKGTWDSPFHRMTQILPTFFNLDKIFFIRFGQDTATDLYDITSELHLSELHNPHGVRTFEHYCRRWITIKLLDELEKKSAIDSDGVAVGVQKVRFFQSENEYICFTLAKRELHAPTNKSSLTIGLQITPLLREKIAFIDDPDIPYTDVSITCERCGISDCEVRAAAATLYENDKRLQKIDQSIENLIQDNSN